MPADLRRARPDEAAILAQIDAEAGAHPWSCGQFGAVCGDGDDSRAMALVLDAGDRINGFIVYSQVLDEASILNIVVRASCQGQGVGGHILMAALQRMRVSGAARCLLEVRHSNRVARQLYQRENFQLDGVRENYYPTRDGREDGLLMSLEF